MITEIQRKPWSLLDHIDHKCPACGSSDIARREEGAAVYYCQNPGCPAALAARIQHLCSRPALDIEGLGEEACDAIVSTMRCEFITAGKEPSPLGIFDWAAKDFAQLEWQTEAGGQMTFGESRGRKAFEAMERAKSLPLNRWLVALGIPSIGVNTSKEISRLFANASELHSATHDDGSWLSAIANEGKDGEAKKCPNIAVMKVSQHLGAVSCGHLIEFGRSVFGQHALNRLAEWGVRSGSYAPIPVITEGLLTGKSFCVTGALSAPRDQIHQLIQDNGGTVVSGVSAKTNYLVAGDKAGSKIQKAEKLGITVLSESELKELIEG